MATTGTSLCHTSTSAHLIYSSVRGSYYCSLKKHTSFLFYGWEVELSSLGTYLELIFMLTSQTISFHAFGLNIRPSLLLLSGREHMRLGGTCRVNVNDNIARRMRCVPASHGPLKRNKRWAVSRIRSLSIILVLLAYVLPRHASLSGSTSSDAPGVLIPFASHF